MGSTHQSTPLIWIGAGMLLISLGLPMVRRGWWAGVPIVLLGLPLVGRGLWLAWRSRETLGEDGNDDA